MAVMKMGSDDGQENYMRHRKGFIDLAEAIRKLDIPVAAKQRLFVPLAERIADDTSLLAPEVKAAFNRERFLAHCRSSYDGTPEYDSELGGWRYQDGEEIVTLVLGGGVTVSPSPSS